MSATCIAPSRRQGRCANLAQFGAYCRHHVPVGQAERTVCRYKNCHGEPQVLSDYCGRHEFANVYGHFQKDDLATIEYKTTSLWVRLRHFLNDMFGGAL